VWVHGDQVTPDLGALFDPLGNAVHTALSFPILGEDVLITGCGPIGLMAIAVCRVAGARNIVATDVVADRLEKALAVGADRVVDVSKERVADAQAALGMLEGFDIGLEMSGQAAAASELIDNLNTGGKVALLGLPSTNIEIDWTKVITRMITIKGIYGREMFDTWHHASAMVDHSPELRHALESLVTARFPLASWQDAFDTARGGAAGKVLIDWTDTRDAVITGVIDEHVPETVGAVTAA
jgi:threonine 3-dehydrogenase